MGLGSLPEEMTRVAGALYAFGGLLLALAALVPTWPGANVSLLLGYAGIALVTATALEAFARKRPMSVPELMVVAVLGLIIITLVLIAGGPHASGTLAVFHVFILAYGFYYFPRWFAFLEVAAIGISYGFVLAALDAQGAASNWILVTGAYAVVGSIFGTISRRVRDALQAEMESVARLHELDDLKTTFLRAVSHELRTPLTNVVGYTTTLRTHHRRLDPDRIEQLLDRAVQNSRKLEQLLVDLLDLDRLGRGIIVPKLALADVGLLARNVAEQMDFRDHPFHVAAQPVAIRVDASKVERIIENLLANAIKHTGASDPIWLRVDASPDGGATIVVEDGGPGVPDGLKLALFEPFAQGPEAADSPTPGTGIGLSLVLRLTHLHAGAVRVEDRPGGGARFIVTLPDAPVTTAAGDDGDVGDDDVGDDDVGRDDRDDDRDDHRGDHRSERGDHRSGRGDVDGDVGVTPGGARSGG